MKVYGSCIHNCPKVDTIQISTTCTNKQSVLYLFSGILLKNENNKLLIYAETWMDFKCIMLNKSSQTRIETCMILFVCNCGKSTATV